MMLHFVGFRGEEYHSAVRVWGKPDFYHRYQDYRALSEFMDNDIVIYANLSEQKINVYSFNDSEVF